MSKSVMKWSEGLRKRGSVIIRRYTDHMKFYMLLSYSFGYVMFHRIYVCMFCMLLFNFVYYVFLLLCLCIFIIMYELFNLLCFFEFFVFCLCLNVYGTAATVCQHNFS